MTLSDSLPLGHPGLDRQAHLRTDPKALAQLRTAPGTRIVTTAQGKLLCDGDRLAQAPLAPEQDPIFLGALEGQAVFAQDLPAPQTAPLGTLRDLRDIADRLPPSEAMLAATARGVFAWHHSHRFCAACGQPSDRVDAGWRRLCPACGTSHFPRTDPVVIMLVEQNDSLLLGRSPAWPAGMYSLLAGFMEPGETVEAAVRREVYEEVGVQIGAVRYVASQPWPFPSSLMLGCHAQATSTTLRLDPVEIEDARWMPRDEVSAMLAGSHPDAAAPRMGSISGQLLRNWVAKTLPRPL